MADNAGVVRIYEWSGSDWTLKGNGIYGVTENERSGGSHSLNGNGTIIAIGSANNSNNSSSGSVRIYEWSGSDWTLKGSQIDGITGSDYFGFAVSINDDGSIVAISDFKYNSNTGFVRIYEWSGSDWTLKGNQINGTQEGSMFGFAVSINDDGSIVAVSAMGYNNSSGAVYIYEWNGSDWTIVDSQINSITEGDNLGYNVSLNGIGSSVAIGAYLASSQTGYVHIYDLPISSYSTDSNLPVNLYVSGDISLNSRLYIQNTNIIDLIETQVATLETQLAGVLQRLSDAGI